MICTLTNRRAKVSRTNNDDFHSHETSPLLSSSAHSFCYRAYSAPFRGRRCSADYWIPLAYFLKGMPQEEVSGSLLQFSSFDGKMTSRLIPFYYSYFLH